VKISSQFISPLFV